MVDVAAVRGLGLAPVFNHGQHDVLPPVRGCIGGEGEPPGGLLLAVRAARYGEARVPAGAFFRYRSLTALTLPAGLTEIRSYAFNSCSSLTTLTLPSSLTTIGGNAFGGCSSLTTLTIISDHAEPRVLTREQPFDTAAVQQALEQARAA